MNLLNITPLENFQLDEPSKMTLTVHISIIHSADALEGPVHTGFIRLVSSVKCEDGQFTFFVDGTIAAAFLFRMAMRPAIVIR